MFDNLKGKKLLILGGIQRTCFLVERARKMGVYVIVADYDKNSPAKRVADEGVLIDAKDVDALCEFCEQRGVNGITTAFVDMLMPICLKVARRMNLPCYMTEEMITVSTDKNSFKEMCRKYDVPVPASYNISSSDYEKAAQSLSYPVFVKPFDGSGSRGANVCNSQAEFIANYQEALRWSKKGGVVVEEFLTGTDIGLDYLLIDGEPYLLSMWDRLMTPDRPHAVNHADLQMLPSRFLDDYMNSLDEKVRKMFKGMGFKDGIIFLQGYANEGKITFFEMGCRLGGTWGYIDEHFIGANPMDMLIHHALTGKMINDISEVNISPRFDGKGAVISLLSGIKSGKIERMIGIDKIKQEKGLVCMMQPYHEGDTFDVGTLTDVAFLRLQLVEGNYLKIRNMISRIYSSVKIEDGRGESLLSPFYDLNILDELYAK